MNLSLAFHCSFLLSGVPSASARFGSIFGKTTTAPHEVHQYEQVKFANEPEWECRENSVGYNVGCIECYNPREIGGEGLVVEVKSIYKRPDINFRDETANPPRKHCIFPGRGSFWTCFNSNLVIEPDTDWLGDLSDKPIYDENGNTGGSQCYPGHLVAQIPDNGAVFF